MKGPEILNSVVIVKSNSPISPQLVTIREYGRWMQEVFDAYTCGFELFLKARDGTGMTTLQYHPGTKIGQWFDKRQFTDPELHSWFVMQKSYVMDRLKKFKLAEYRDAVPISVTDERGRRMIRLYSTRQLELYLQSVIDKKFSIAQYLDVPKQIKIRDADFNRLLIPQIKKPKQSLF